MPAQGEVSGAIPHRVSTEGTRMPDVLVVGGGVIGLGIAWRCGQRGLAVTVVDPAPGSGASYAAAGMLAPVTELHYGEQALLRLNLDSADRFPEFAAELAAASKHEVGYRRSGALVAAWDDADLASLRDLQSFGSSLGLATELLTGRDLRRRGTRARVGRRGWPVRPERSRGRQPAAAHRVVGGSEPIRRRTAARASCRPRDLGRAGDWRPDGSGHARSGPTPWCSPPGPGRPSSPTQPDAACRRSGR